VRIDMLARHHVERAALDLDAAASRSLAAARLRADIARAVVCPRARDHA
jgi:hypothetical protein